MRQTGVLYIFELRKIVNRKIVWISGVIMVFLCAFLSFGDLFSSFDYGGTKISGYEKIKISREYAGNLAGVTIDDALLRKMKASYPEGVKESNVVNDRMLGISGSVIEETEENGEKKVTVEQIDGSGVLWKYEPVYSLMQKIVENGILETDAGEMYAERKHLISQNRADQMLTEKELRYWEKKDSRIQIPFTYVYAEGWGRLWEYAYTINDMLLFMLAICLSGVFSVEHLQKTNAVILCSRYGKRHLYLAKMLAGVTFGAAAGLLLFGTAAISSICIYGADGFDAALQLVFPLSSWEISVGESVLILLALLLIISVLYSIGIMVLSEIIRNRAAVMAFPVGLMTLTMLFDIPYQFRIPSQVYDLFPTNLLIKWELWDDRLVSVCGKFFTNVQIAPVIYMIAAALLFFAGKRIDQECQVGV